MRYLLYERFICKFHAIVRVDCLGNSSFLILMSWFSLYWDMIHKNNLAYQLSKWNDVPEANVLDIEEIFTFCSIPAFPFSVIKIEINISKELVIINSISLKHFTFINCFVCSYTIYSKSISFYLIALIGVELVLHTFIFFIVLSLEYEIL